MKHGSTIFLRLALIVFGAIVAAICFFALPVIYREWPIEYPEIAQLNGIVVAGLGATAILFYAALYQVWRLLQLIDRNQAFSATAERALRLISYDATGISAIYGAGLPVVYAMAQLEDALSWGP